jgi:hypothetical protein
VSQTITSSGFYPSDFYFNNRLLPIFDFTAETASSGTSLGYHTIISFTSSGGFGSASGSIDGCYRINWD